MYCRENNKKLVLDCDANAHHTIWGNTDNNSHGDELLENILFYNLCFLKKILGFLIGFLLALGILNISGSFCFEAELENALRLLSE